MLEVTNVTVSYGPIQAVKGLNMRVKAGSMVTLLGANGAGKSSCLRAISGLARPSSGSIKFKDQEIVRWSPQKRVLAGLAHVMEGRRLFGDQTVQQCLELGAYLRFQRPEEHGAIRLDIEDKYRRFPVLSERRRQYAATLSGGEQQMLVISTALMSRPDLLLLDEPSLGLAPKMIVLVFEALQELRQQGVTILLVEQMANMALQVADYGYVLSGGRLVEEGPGEELQKLLASGGLKSAYLGTA